MSEQNVIDASSRSAAVEFEGGDFGGSDFEPEDSSDSGNAGEPGPGMGQSKSSRRRRRKRKSRVAGDGSPATAAAADTGSAGVPFVMEGESIALAAAAATPQPAPQPRRQQSSQASQQPQPGQAQGGKRWKKKFRDRERRPASGARNENPGNDFRTDATAANGNGNGNGYRPDNFGNQNGGFKRKNKGGQQKERGFVGPMDHSYRVGGEFGDVPPSTIQISTGHGRRGGHRHHGDSQPIDHSMPRPVPIPEGAQTHIYFFIEELFFIAKIQEAARKLGVKVAFIKNDKEALAELTDSEENRPALIVFDLNNANAKPLTLIPKLKTKLKRSASIVGFLSHLQGDLKAKAVEAGCDVVMPRAAFSQNLPNLLRRYGVEEEEEVNFNY
jgi:hypothetical protein